MEEIKTDLVDLIKADQSEKSEDFNNSFAPDSDFIVQPNRAIELGNRTIGVSKIDEEASDKMKEAGKEDANLCPTLKVILLGSSNAGKSSLLTKFCGGVCRENSTDPTVAIACQAKTMKVDDSFICLEIWDTGGQERFYSLTRMYFRNSQGAIVVFDLSKKNSLDDACRYIEDFRASCPENAQQNIVLVGNKSDLPRKVDP